MPDRKKQRKKQAGSKSPEKAQVTESPTATCLFSVTEYAVVAYFLLNHEKNKPVTIQELNRLLGVAHKNSTTQKKNRSLLFTAINAKSPVTLILKKRYPQDKRRIYYCLSKEGEIWLRNMLESKK